MGNEATKQQIRNWIEKAIKEAKDPDPRKIIKRKREKKRKEIAKEYGL